MCRTKLWVEKNCMKINNFNSRFYIIMNKCPMSLLGLLEPYIWAVDMLRTRKLDSSLFTLVLYSELSLGWLHYQGQRIYFAWFICGGLSSLFLLLGRLSQVNLICPTSSNNNWRKMDWCFFPMVFSKWKNLKSACLFHLTSQ